MIFIIFLAIALFSGAIVGVMTAAICVIIYRRPMLLAVGGIAGAISAVPAFILMGIVIYVINERYPSSGNLATTGIFFVGAGILIFICSLIVSLLTGFIASRRTAGDTIADYQPDARDRA